VWNILGPANCPRSTRVRSAKPRTLSDDGLSARRSRVSKRTTDSNERIKMGVDVRMDNDATMTIKVIE
jgi:hypothetical protein